ncbi:DegV family protein [Coprothermobacteraceae bacterium]|nr:DegV family protein [Coprothermobacteraceae bacterium]
MSKRRIGFITDSGAYPLEKPEHVEVVELRLIKGGQSYKELSELNWDQFYRDLRHAKELPTTSAPPVAEIHEAVERLLDRCDVVLGIWLSRHFSATFQEAEMIAQDFQGRLLNFDTKIVAAAQYRMLMEGVKAAEMGWAVEDILNHLSTIRDAYRVMFLASIHHLAKGGRIGKASALAGQVLRLQPLLYVDDGVVSAYKVVRGRQQAIKEMVQYIKDVFGDQPIVADLAWSDNFNEVMVLENIMEEQGLKRDGIARVGPVLGTHLGPDLLAVLGVPKGLLL